MMTVNIAAVIFLTCTLFGRTSGQFFGSASCTARCNSTFSLLDVIQQNCRCDEGCTTTNSCCGDYDDYCVSSCRRRCGQIYHPLLACQCHEDCQQNCCDDFQDLCLRGVVPTRKPNRPRTTTTTTPATYGPIEIGYSYLSGREIVCPKGVEFVDCYINPCETPCSKYPDATCFVQECGVCEAKFFDTWGNQLDCYDPEKFCSDGRPLHDCGNIDLCEYATCPGYPRAICVPNRCGGCHYDFVDEKGNIIECDESNNISPCKPGTRLQKCYPLPCTLRKCIAHPNATCQNIVCGECKAEFTDEFRNVLDCDVPESAPCLDDLTCPGDPCNDAECPAYFDAECRATPCDECKATFYRDGKKLRDVDCVIPNACYEEMASSCYRDPCSMYTCQGQEVICIAQYCDGCSVLFFDMDGKRLTESDCNGGSQPATPPQSICPRGKIPSVCDDSPCRSAVCQGFPNTFCGTDVCNDCRPIFFDVTGNQVECKQAGEDDKVDSCEERCGEMYRKEARCQCDYGCLTRGDCCPKFEHTCDTCQNRCGAYQRSASCQCTSDCRLRGNCCHDFVSLCLQTRSCKGKCNSAYQRKELCQCDMTCARRGNCCPDYFDYCL